MKMLRSWLLLLIALPVAAHAQNLTWSGTNGNLWDNNVTQNWNTGGSPATFLPTDNVVFDDTSSNGSVTLSGSLLPGSVTINNTTTAYTISGTGHIAGTAGLLKSGTGTLTISSTNSYSGGAVISAGTVIVSNTNALGTGNTTLGDVNTGTNNVALLVSGTFSHPITISSAGAGSAILGRSGMGSATISSTLTLNRNLTFQSAQSGTLSVTGLVTGNGDLIFSGSGLTLLNATTGFSGTSIPPAWTGNASVTGSATLQTSTNNLLNNHNLDIGAGSNVIIGITNASGTFAMLTGGGNIGGSGSTATLNLSVGANGASSTFAGTIGTATLSGVSTGSSVTLTKISSGTFTLTGNNTYTGITTISAGALAISGTGGIANSGTIKIAQGANLNTTGYTGTFALASGQKLIAGQTSSGSSGFTNDVVGNIATGQGTINVAGTGTAATMVINGNLILNGGTLALDFSNNATAGNGINDLISVSGNISLGGTTSIFGNLLNGSLSSGSYLLVSGAGITAGSAANLAWVGSLQRQSVTFDTTSSPGSIYLSVTGVAANLVWAPTGTANAVWDTNTTANWSNSGTADKFLAGDNVTFDDTSAAGSVNLSGTVSPSSVTVNNGATTYVISGSGSIAGAASVLKSGTGLLRIVTVNSYSGGTVISAGTLASMNGGSLGSGMVTIGDSNTGTNTAALQISSSTFANPITVSNQGSGLAIINGSSSTPVTISSTIALNRDVTFTTSGTTNLNISGTFTGSGNAIFSGSNTITLALITGSNNVTNWTGNASTAGTATLILGGTANPLNDRTLDIGAGSRVALTQSGTYEFAGLTGSGSIGNMGNTVTVVVGGSNASSTFAGSIGLIGSVSGTASTSAVSLNKIGSGTFTMTGRNTYTGVTNISQGTLAMAGSGTLNNSSRINIVQGAVLDVSGLNSGIYSVSAAGGQTLVAGRTSGFATDIKGNVGTLGGGANTINIAGTGTAGTLTINGNLSLGGGFLAYDFANTTTAGSGVNDLIAIGGNLTLSGTTTIQATLLNGALGSGTYTLVSGGTAISAGNASNLVYGGTLFRQSVSFDTTTTPGAIYMIVTGAPGVLTWSGTNGNIWDANTPNWSNGGTPDKFLPQDNVTFDDTGSSSTVAISSSSLQPGSVTVNNSSTNYTFSGTGHIIGPTSLLKIGSGTLTITNSNSYTGSSVIGAGTVIVSNTAALGSGTVVLGNADTGTYNPTLLLGTTFSRPVVVSSLGSGTAIIGRSGTANETISSTMTLNRDLAFQSLPGGTLNVAGVFTGSGNITFIGGGTSSLNTPFVSGSTWTGNASVEGGSALMISGSNNPLNNKSLDIGAGSSVTITTSGTFTGLTGAGSIGLTGSTPTLFVGGSNASSTFAGNIGTTGTSVSSMNLAKIGSGTFTLAGNNTYTGATNVSQGTLALTGTGSISHSTLINVTSGAVFDVSGLSTGTYALAAGQSLIAGRTSAFATDINGSLATANNSASTLNIAGTGTAGTLRINGNLALGGSTLAFDFTNSTTAGSHVNDLISIAGNVSLSGTTVILPTLLNGGLASGFYTLVSGAAITAGSGANLAWGGPATRQTIAFDTTTTPGTVYMTVSGSAANLVWSGSSGNMWDANSSSWNNTSSSGTTDKFYGLDNVTFDDSNANGNVTLAGTLQPASVTVNNNTTDYTLSGSGQIAGSTSLVKTGTGSLTITGSQAYTGSTEVNNGSLTVNGNIITSSTISVSSGASIGGHGVVGNIAGSGTVAPGDPQIFTAGQADPSGGLDFSFQFGKSGSPVYSNAADSGNDVIHLTDSTPFKFALTSANTITVDFTGLTLTPGEIFYGGFFTDTQIDPTMISGAVFVFTGLNGASVRYDGLVTVASADFTTGTVTNGQIMQFEVIPEPGSCLLFGAGTATLLLSRRRRKRL